MSEEIEKIARHAAKLGLWDAKTAEEAINMAKLHVSDPGGPRVFLRRLLERRCGLTYDELARLEREALAPPAVLTPSKPLPKLGAARPASSTTNPTLAQPTELPSTGKLPRLDAKPDSKSDAAPLPREGEMLTPKKPLPRLNAPKKPPSEG